MWVYPHTPVTRRIMDTTATAGLRFGDTVAFTHGTSLFVIGVTEADMGDSISDQIGDLAATRRADLAAPVAEHGGVVDRQDRSGGLALFIAKRKTRRLKASRTDPPKTHLVASRS
jgi:hypothetical protein